MGSDQANQHGMMISIPVGGPGEGQQCVHYGPTVCPLPIESQQCLQPPTSDAESGVLSVSTATLEGTPLGDEEPEGFHRSDTEPPTDPSVERELPEEAEVEDSRQAADDIGPNDQSASNPEEPEEGGLPTQKVFNLLDGVSIHLKARGEAVPASIQVSLDSLLQVPDNPYGDVPTMEVQEPTLNHTLMGDSTLSPSAPPEFLMEQAFQTEPFAQPHEPKALHEESGVDQRVQSGLDQREERAKETYRAQLHADQLSDLEHDERWEGVRLYPGLPKPTDEGQELQKTLKVDSSGKQHDKNSEVPRKQVRPR